MLLALFLLLVVALRFAQPIEDGDIFWHMAYGAKMLERGTLHLDHTPYSWMPASNALIYCAWTGELLFRLFWNCFGAAGVFALRYAAVLTVLGLLALQARRSGLLARAETWLVLLVALLASVVATLPKPEMLSLVLWNGLVFCWFALLDARDRERSLLPWIYAMPCVVLVWVNTHGAFILAAPFIAMTTAAGFFLLPCRAAWHLTGAAALSGAATAVTPYGLRYPLQLLRETLGLTNRPDIGWNNAFQSTLGGGGRFNHLPELLIWMVLILAATAWMSRRRGRVAVVLLSLAYTPLYLIYVRATFLLPALFGYGVLYLARDVPRDGRWRRVVPALAGIAFLLLGGRSIAEAALRPDPIGWMGFGIGYSQPVAEAEFLARGDYGPRIYNTYNAGGYLIWRLFPRYKVMVDARSFPYVAWFAELVQFTRTQNPAVFQAFLERHPGDVALVDFQEELVWRSFLQMPDWRPAFYGPSAAVFVPRAGAPKRPEAAASLLHLRNGADGRRVFDFAIAVGDYRTAWSLLDQLQGPLRGEARAYDLARMITYRNAQAALRAGNYKRAWDGFQAAFQHHPIEGQDKVILLLLRGLQQIGALDPRATTIRAALAKLSAAGS